jgi:hypothetical protein
VLFSSVEALPLLADQLVRGVFFVHSQNCQQHGIHQLYDAACEPDVALVIATGEQRVYANILLTIGVVPPPK